MAAQSGVAVFETFTNPVQTFNVQFYLDDTAGNPILWDTGGGDASKGSEEWRPPVPVRLRDFIIAGATGQTKTTINKAGYRVATLLNSVFLASITTRPALALTFGPQVPISGNQVA